MGIVDLRSDTVTQPTTEMREAMAKAEVGDDVFGEDPTVNELERISAEKMGKEAGLFVASGTMGNLCAVLAHCNRGDEVIMGNLAHTFLFEGGGVAALGGVQPRTLQNQPDATIKLEEIRDAIRPNDVHHPISRLIILENTHNRCGGIPLSPDYVQSVGNLAQEKGLALHVDGARIFNASVALGVDPIALVKPADSVTFCLSKALCAPVGSVLCGSKEFIYKARRIRKQVGGGMRQAGVLAAAGTIALEKMVDRLSEDHARARELAKGLVGISWLRIENESPPTNMVFASLEADFPISASAVASKLLDHQVKVGVVGARRFRMVTHNWITDEGITRVINAFKQIL